MRSRSENDLKDISRLSDAFRAATLTALQTAFLSATSGTDKTAAETALSRFHQAAHKLRISENAFNNRARPDNNKPSLMAHMRGPEQFAAMRDFSAAKETLLGFSPEVGRSIVRLVAQSIDMRADLAHGRPSGPAAIL